MCEQQCLFTREGFCFDELIREYGDNLIDFNEFLLNQNEKLFSNFLEIFYELWVFTLFI